MTAASSETSTSSKSSSSRTLSNNPTISSLESNTTSVHPSIAPDSISHPISIMSSTNLTTSLLPSQRHQFLQPPASLFKTAIDNTKILLDPHAADIADEHVRRTKEDRKRKRNDDVVHGEILKVRKVFTEGFSVEQVWEQARRVIDALREEVERDVEELGVDEDDEGDDGAEVVKSVRFDEQGFEIGSGDESLDGEDEDEQDDTMGIEEMESGEDDEFEEPFPTKIGEIGVEDGEEDEDDEDDLMGDFGGEDDYDEENEDNDDNSNEDAGVFEPDPHGLNDGFFSIDDFNKQTEFLEQADANADLNTGEASDEEDIDWDADPMAQLSDNTKTKTAKKVMADESDDEEDGPTFGNVDLNAPEGDSGDEDLEMDDDMQGPDENTNEILYKDFFQPPPRKLNKGERQTDYLERQARKEKANTVPEDAEGDMNRAINDVRRDLFDDESENEYSEDALSEVDAGNPQSRKSAHERRQQKLNEEIRKLEAASVAKREWTLSGEARAADRPLNSLLEEDLDFERAGKPVPVITAEVSESIEELIKRRILAQEFDEVIRRRPDADSVPSNTRRGQFELDDSKAQQSLAEIYEEEHVKNNNPDAYVSKADEKLKKQHQEIEGLWKDISGKLDSLSSWHYKPKPAAPSLTVVADVATITMEDAQPTTALGVAGGESMLAPQEIYKAGKDKAAIAKGEVVAGGAPIAREEMSREEKTRRRRREKERIQKRGGEELGNAPESKRAKEKKETVGELKRAGVKVIGKRGEVRDVEGNKVKAVSSGTGGGGFKL